MHLSPREKDKLLVYLAGQVACSRKDKGLKLNYVEALAIISAEIIEGAREGKTVTRLQEKAAGLLKKEDLLEGVAEMLECVQVEATFPDGTKLVTVFNPIRQGEGMKPGEYFYNSCEITLNKNRKTVKLKVKNTDSRPVQIGSHFHFFEVNKALLFDRRKAFGMRLDIPSGAAVRFEPSEEKEVNLVALGGRKNVYGLNGLTNGNISSAKVVKDALRKAKSKGFKEVRDVL